jgi:DNA-binding LytR/AlgR family response regulator
MIMNCVVIDDEPLARECISNYIAQIDFLNISGVSINPVGLSRLLNEQQIDLVFLDIEMPGMNGIEFLKMSEKLPMVIITTAYPSFALESYQLDVLDYLVKPITFNRFFKAVNKARDYFQLLHSSSAVNHPAPAADYFFIKCDYKFEKIYFNEILYVEAMLNYVTIYTEKGRYITLLYLSRNYYDQVIERVVNNRLWKK